MGVSVRRLEIPGVEDLTGAGVYYGAALTEAANYRGQDVFIVGGGNSAGQAAMYFSGYARRVYLIVRSSALGFGMSHYLVEQIQATPTIEVRYNADVVEAFGKNKLEGICVQNKDSGENETLPGAAMFIFIGAVPHTEIVAGVVERDRPGFILTGNDLVKNDRRPRGWNLKRDPYLLETSSPGIFAAGDVRHGSVKRVASAVGEGAVSIALVHQYLKTV
jgi:thioredoxin reductase (NADPH)